MKSTLTCKKRFLDDKRTQSVGITIAKLPPPEKIKHALSEMDKSLLTKAQIDSLYKEFITREEYDTYLQIGEDGNWDHDEKYLIQINSIPNAKTKLHIWSTLLEFNDSFPGVQESFSYMQDACNELKQNKFFKEMLSAILTIGNVLNGGTQKGQADGFSLDVLPKLSSVKDNKGQTVLNWVCHKVKKIDDSFDGLKKYFPQLIKASAYSLSECVKSLNELKRFLTNIQKELKDIETQDNFINEVNNTLNDYNDKIKQIEKLSNDNLKVYQNTAKYFGYTEKDSKYKAPEEFFRMLCAFFDDVERSMPKPEVKRTFNSKTKGGKKIDQKAVMDNILSQLRLKNK